MQSNSGIVVILGTGGTIAGRSSQAGDNVGYKAGEVAVADLVAAVPALQGRALEAEQVAQLDSKDMDHATWQRLAQRVAHHLARPEVAGIVVTHGTDTAEETAWLLQRVLAPAKPVVLAVAMRPASSLQADGPQNLADAVAVASEPGALGVVLVADGRVHGAEDVRKLHGYRVDTFSSGDAGLVARLEEGRVMAQRPWPHGEALGLERLVKPVASWPRVGLVCSHAAADDWAVRAAVAAGLRGLVVEGTGNGTLNSALEPALRDAQRAGLRVLRASRCLAGGVVGAPEGAWPSAGALTPAKARVELLLQLLEG
jgi:L-asparaginase